MIGKIISPNIKESQTYIIKEVENGRLFVERNTNDKFPDKFHGLAPVGEYSVLNEIVGPVDNLKIIRADYSVLVDEDGLITLKTTTDATYRL